MVGEEILLEIDSTLDQLICNAEAVQTISFNELSETEIDAFQKTQESLIQHLLYMDQCLTSKTPTIRLEAKSARAQIQAKKQKFEQLKASYHSSLRDSLTRKSDILSKRRCKRFF
jgi:hypothetical protein